MRISRLTTGPSAPAGFSLFVFIVPIQERIMARQFNTSGKSVKFTDLGARILLEVLRIYDIRANEVRGIRNIQHVQSANIAVAFSLPILASTLVFVAYMRATSGFDIRSLSKIADARNALSRFKAVFNAQTLNEALFKIDPAQEYALDAQGVSFEWESTMKGKVGRRRWCLKRRRWRWWRREESRRGSGRSRCRTPRCASRAGRSRASLGVSGLGADKSSLMQGLIGEMRRIGGELSFGGGVAYYAQTTWIRNATVRENVLFGKPFESDRYWRIMEEIGEKGINLLVSGGQKAACACFSLLFFSQVNIARAVYYDADIVIFDHPVLAGTYQELITRGGEFSRLDKEFGGTAVEEPTENLVTVTVTVEDLKAKSAEAAGTGKIVERVYTSYIKTAHGRYILACVIVAVLGMQGCQISNCYTPVWWQAKCNLVGAVQAIFTFLVFAFSMLPLIVSY
ncbi:hypothetical protein B0H13DRAFT_1899808 [Mycena leptocephala]|nr:hypothetical protein B0H13DRAFT_1899808 [Mycena leptocephala]